LRCSTRTHAARSANRAAPCTFRNGRGWPHAADRYDAGPSMTIEFQPFSPDARARLTRAWPVARPWFIWGAILTAATVAMYYVRTDINEGHVALAYLLIVLGGSVSGGGALGFPAHRLLLSAAIRPVERRQAARLGRADLVPRRGRGGHAAARSRAGSREPREATRR